MKLETLRIKIDRNYKRTKNRTAAFSAFVLIICATFLFLAMPTLLTTSSAADGCSHTHDATCGYISASPCTHSHDTTCGYAAASPCPYTHTHNESCGYEEESSTGCTDSHTHDSSCGYLTAVACTHEHNEFCNFVTASPCDHTCNETYDDQSFENDEIILYDFYTEDNINNSTNINNDYLPFHSNAETENFSEGMSLFSSNEFTYEGDTFSGTINVAFSERIDTAEDGISPYTYSADPEVFPILGGINLVDGVLTGTPTQAGTRTVTITATDSTSDIALVAQAVFTITINLPTPTTDELLYDLTTVPFNGSTQPIVVSKAALVDGLGAITVLYNGVEAEPVNAGNYIITVNIATGTNYSGITGLSLGMYTINRIDPVVGDLDFNITAVPFNGSAQPVSVTPNATATTNGLGAITILYDAISTEPINAGNYTVTVNISASTNYNAATGLSLGMYTINRIDPVVGDLDFNITAVPFNGSAQPVSVTPNATATANGLGTITDVLYNTVTTEPINAGNYTVTVNISASTNYNAATGLSLGTYTINRIDPVIGNLDFNLTSVPFNGSAQPVSVTPNATATTNGLGTITDVLYNTVTTEPTNAGNYTVTVNIAASTNYNAATGLSLGTYTINRIDPVVGDLGFNLTSVPFNGSAQPVSVTPNATATTNGLGAITVLYDSVSTIPINVGNYTVTVDIAVSTNYNAATGLSLGTYTITRINPVISDLEFDLSPVYYTGLPIAVVVEPTAGVDGLGAISVLYDGVDTAPTVIGSYEITVNIAEGANYNAVTGLSLGSFTINEVPDAGVTLTPDGLTNFGTLPFLYTTAPDALTIEVENIGIEDTGLLTISLSGAPTSSFTLSVPSISNIAPGATETFTVRPNSGLSAITHTETINVTGTDISSSLSVTFTVSKIDPPTVAWPTGLTATVGQTLANVSLTSFTNPTLAGLFTWTAAETTLVGAAGSQTHNVTFTPNETINYNNVTNNVTILVSPVPTYGITLNQTGTQIFTAAAYGYSAQTPLSVSITNTGNQDTGTLAVALSGPNATSFTLSAASVTSIAAEGSASNAFTVVPQTGLASGTYTATVTVSGGNNISTSFGVSFTVNRADPIVSTWPSGLTATFGQTLANVPLLPGNGSANVPGIFEWVDSSTSVGNVTTTNFPVRFTPDSISNYNTVSGVAPVSVGQATTTGTPQEVFFVQGTAGSQSFDLTTLHTGLNMGGTVGYSIGTIIGNIPGISTVPASGAATGPITISIGVASSGQSATIPVTITSTNYTIFTVNITISITAKTEVTISGVSVANKVYDGVPVAPSGSVSAGAANVSSLVWLYEATDGGAFAAGSTPPVNAGAYKLTISLPATDPLYFATSLELPFTISRRPVTLIADDHTVVQGSLLPTLTFTVTNLAPGQDAVNALIAAPTLSSQEFKSLEPGDYPIIITGGTESANYMITTRTNGIITVNAPTVEPQQPDTIINTDSSAEFITEALFDHLHKLFFNGIEIAITPVSATRALLSGHPDFSGNIGHAESGSTIIVLYKEFLDILPDGTHEIIMHFSADDGSNIYATPETTFTINRTTSSITAPETPVRTTPSRTRTTRAPLTGDYSNTALWWFVLSASAFGVILTLSCRKYYNSKNKWERMIAEYKSRSLY